MFKTLKYFVHSFEHDRKIHNFINCQNKKILQIYSISEYVYDPKLLEQLINVADIVELVLYSGFLIPPNKHKEMYINICTKFAYMVPNNIEYIATYNDSDKNEYILKFLEYHPNSKIYVKFENDINYLSVAKHIIFDINNDNYEHFVNFANYINDDAKIRLNLDFGIKFFAKDLLNFGDKIYEIKITPTNIEELSKYVKLVEHKLIINIITYVTCSNYDSFIDALYEKPNIVVMGHINEQIENSNIQNKILTEQIRYKKIKSAANY